MIKMALSILRPIFQSGFRIIQPLSFRQKFFGARMLTGGDEFHGFPRLPAIPQIRVRMYGDKEFLANLHHFTGTMGPGGIRGLVKAYGEITLNWVQDNMTHSGGLLHDGPWKPLRPLTIASRRGRSSKPLLDTGKLRQGWNYRTKTRSVEIGHPSDVAVWQNYGTKGPYPIVPKNRKALRFGVPFSRAVHPRSLKAAIYAKKVNHPGLPARRMLPNEKEIMPDLIRGGEAFIQNALRNAGLD